MTDLELFGGGMKVRKTAPEEIREEQKSPRRGVGGDMWKRGEERRPSQQLPRVRSREGGREGGCGLWWITVRIGGLGNWGSCGPEHSPCFMNSVPCAADSMTRHGPYLAAANNTCRCKLPAPPTSPAVGEKACF